MIKPDVSIVPRIFIRMLTYPFMLGAVKYGRNSWRTAFGIRPKVGGKSGQYEIYDKAKADAFRNARAASMMRHAEAYTMRGERHDKEGFLHLAAVAWNALTVATYDHVLDGTPLLDEGAYSKAVEMHNDIK